ncbi:F-box protein CPR1 [Linum perenne]
MPAGGGGRVYLTEDLAIKILLSLPDVSCIARFRCVCRSWGNLLSDPNLIRKIIFYKSSNDQKTLQILITGMRGCTGPPPLGYILYSYETFRPITEHRHLLTPSSGEEYKLIGCCDGICLLTNAVNPKRDDILLWNPVTSETKILPPGPSHPARISHGYNVLALVGGCIGLGFDPQTNDYKVIRVMEFELGGHHDYETEYEPHELYHGDFPLAFTEVYSLRNDSWKTLNVSNNRTFGRSYSNNCLHLRQQSRNEKCYWFVNIISDVNTNILVSFDMATEVFESVTFLQPLDLNSERRWILEYCFMSKGIIVATFTSATDKISSSNETWAMLKFGVTKSWTKLFTSVRECDIIHLEVWKDCMHICSRGDNWSVKWAHGEILISNPVTSKVICDRIETKGINYHLSSCIFTPTQVSLVLS